MKKIVLMGVLGLGLLLPAQAGTDRLIGSYKSNKEVTLAYLKTHTTLSPEQLERVSKFLGKMVVTFDAKTVTEATGAGKFSSPYTIVEETKDTITIESLDADTKKMSKSKFDVDTNGIWAIDERIKGYKERFDKVAKN